MSGADDEFLQTLRSTFRVEAAEHLQAIGAGLIELEKVTARAEQLPLIETVYRAAHSLKGAARAVDLLEIETVCQSLETLFAAWKRGESGPTAAALDAAHRAVDRMTTALAEPGSRSAKASSPPPLEASSPTSTPLPTPQPPAKVPATPAPATVAAASDVETVRVAVSSLDARLLEAEEMLSAKLAAGQRAIDLGALSGQFDHWRKEWSRVQPQARALRRQLDRRGEAPSPAGVTGLIDFVDWNHDYVRSLEAKVSALRRTAEQDQLAVGKLVEDLLENSKQLLKLPLSTLGALLPKLVRDLSRDQGKEAELTVRGDEVKLDKRVLEEMKDPLIHLLRNCVDHGIEKPEQRRKAGKPPRATITIDVSQVDGSQVAITVSDDGAGINVDKVKAAACKQGRLTPEAARGLSESAALALIFEADVSTSPMITQVSGRGLGLAIVREKTEKLGGRLSVESSRNAGTTIRMVLPQTLATFRGVLILSAQRQFVIPTAQVERVARFRPSDVKTVEGRTTLVFNGQTVALVQLSEVLQLPPARQTRDPPEATAVLILGSGDQRVAFAVDAVLDEREVLVKRLAKPLLRVRNIAGATVLGTGEVAPILNVPDLLKSARHASGVLQTPAVESQPEAGPARRVMVAEDSITSRMLLKGILESAGYQVSTAVDGIDAFTALRAERFDVLVSDVEMPRLNGIDLTARIRADRTLSELPVVLVTALESREDRERGLEAGANAYLVKSSLDQSNLLEVLRRLV